MSILAPFATAAAAAAGLAQAPAPSPDHYTLIRCGHVIAVPSAGTPWRDNATVVVKNGRVDALIDGFDGPDLIGAKKSGATVTELDLKQSWVLPGLIDCHVHLTNVYDKEIRNRAVRESDEYVTLKSAQNARATVLAGFTTVRDLGAEPSVIFALRDAINDGITPGPRIVAAGHAISVTGGHGDFTLGYKPGLFPTQRPEDGIADGTDECVKAVRNQIKLGADVIKMTATGGVLSAAATGTRQHFTDEELAAIVKTAHSLGRKAAAHAHGTDGINAALRAGVDSIEHASYLDDESITLFKQHNAYHVPTLLAGATVAANAVTPGFYPRMVVPKALEIGPRAMEAFRKSHAAGVKIAFGTDTGVSPHGENAKEFALMVQGGMTPAEAITAATVNAADLLGLSREVGTLEPGKSADLIAVGADPLKDVTELQRVRAVVRAGVVLRPN